MNKKLMHFTAEWCGPCQAMRPIISKFKEDNPDIEYEMIDIEVDPEQAKLHNVMAVPTFISYVDGKQHTSYVGALPGSKIKDLFPKENEQIFKTSDMESSYLQETDAMGREMFWKDAGRP